MISGDEMNHSNFPWPYPRYSLLSVVIFCWDLSDFIITPDDTQSVFLAAALSIILSLSGFCVEMFNMDIME